MRTKRAFTLIELLVVIAIIAILISVTMPSLTKTRRLARAVVCRSNICQLALVNITYSQENDNKYVLAASDLRTANLNRWHGVRESTNDPFDSKKGPLASYLADGQLKVCPGRTEFRHFDPWDSNFEDGCGGYGYNMTYIGSRVWKNGFNACGQATKQNEISRPVETVMFADTAMSKLDNGVPYYLEYSFAEAPYFLNDGRPDTSWYASPSIHFRHDRRANIAWADGHVDSQIPVEYDGINAYGVKSSDMGLGWFGQLNNASFDLK